MEAYHKTVSKSNCTANCLADHLRANATYNRTNKNPDPAAHCSSHQTTHKRPNIPTNHTNISALQSTQWTAYWSTNYLAHWSAIKPPIAGTTPTPHSDAHKQSTQCGPIVSTIQ